MVLRKVIILSFMITLSSPVLAAQNEVSTEQIEGALSKELAAKGAGERVQVMLSGAQQKRIYTADAPMELQIKGLSFDNKTKRWSANLLLVSGDKVLTAFPANGRYQEMTQLPVLVRAIAAGEAITEADIEYAEYPMPRLRGDLIAEAEKLIGKTPRRTLSAHRPLREADISAPVTVHKGALVQMNYKTDTMSISTSGQAMDGGSVGDVIQVRNLASKAVVRAVIEDGQSVSVAPLVQQSALMGDAHVN